MSFETFDRFAQFEESKGKSIDELLDMFAALRAERLAELEAMKPAPEQLALRGVHPKLGTVTLGQLLATWVVHDLNHIAQIARALSYQYHGEVGPWQNYLAILNK